MFHSGGTGGYRSYIAFDPKRRTGVVVLSNLATSAGPNDIGLHLLDTAYPLLKEEPPEFHPEVPIDTKTFDRYVGTYELAPVEL